MLGKISNSNSSYIDIDSNPSLGNKPDGSAYMATSLASGDSYVCAILDDDGDRGNGGPMKCWGKIYDGNYKYVDIDSNPSLGNKADGSAYMATSLASGNNHICVILDDDGNVNNGGTVKCWGKVSSEGGDDVDVDSNPSLGNKPDGSAYRAIALALGEKQACAILDDDGNVNNGGTVKCWGKVHDGNSWSNIDSSPFLGNKPDGSAYMATSIVAGDRHTCVLLDDDGDISNGGPMKCWGSNRRGQIGGGSLFLGTKKDGSAYRVTSLISGEEYTCTILDDDGDTNNGGPVKCWGRIYDGSIWIDMDSNPSLGNKGDGSAYMATFLAAGEQYACAILDDDGSVNNGGPVKCWGKIYDYSNSDYVDVDSNPSLGNKGDGSVYMATFLAAGEDHTCAILDDDGDRSNGGPVKCWGHNGQGQTGGGSPSLGSKGNGSAYMATFLAAGEGHTCAILDDDGNVNNGGPVKCWGEIYDENSRAYVDVDSNPSLGNKGDGSAYMATSLAAGERHTCAILDDDGNVSNGGPVKCWGDNRYGQSSPSLGNKPDGSVYMATSLAAGWYHTCAILDDDGDRSNGGPVKCWGDNRYGQSSPSLGNKPDGSVYMATSLALGEENTCVILDDSKFIRFWGLYYVNDPVEVLIDQ